MSRSKLFTLILAAVFALALLTGALQVERSSDEIRTTLHNIQDYVASAERSGIHFAIEDGTLFTGTPNRWRQINTPVGVSVSAIASDYKDSNSVPVIYIGAANELALYHSLDFGESWIHTPLALNEAGGITEITLDAAQKVLYVGTDTSGIYRLRDAGNELRVNNHILIDQPILEIVSDSAGVGIAYARTEWQLYRADQYGMRWFEVEGMPSAPTALAIANTMPATAYVGTVGHGILKNSGGKNWVPHNQGLQYGAGNRMRIDALAVDQTDPNVLYASASYLFGSRNTQSQSAGAFMTTDGTTWEKMLAEQDGLEPIVDLFPIHGEVGSVFALTDQSSATAAFSSNVESTASTAQINSSTAAASSTEAATNGWNKRMISWIIAGLAALALLFAILTDIRRRTPVMRQPVIE